MAHIRKHRSKWQAIIRRKGHTPQTKSFEKKRDAILWAQSIESKIDMGATPYEGGVALSTITFREVLTRYSNDVTPTKKSHVHESSRIRIILRHPIAELSLDRLTSGAIARYRDHRLKKVGAQTVLHELNTISVIINTAMMEWDIPIKENPATKIKKPRQPSSRERRLHQGELKRLVKASNAVEAEWLGLMIEVAVETAMRRGEILGLRWQDIDLHRRIAFLADTKNGSSREVPLTARAVQILEHQKDQDLKVPFPYGLGTFRRAWENVVDHAGSEGLTFHDLRHEGVSRLFEKGLSIPEVALISGHKDFRMLARYTHLKAADLVGKI